MENLEMYEETQVLSLDQMVKKYNAQARLLELYAIEELYWHQRSNEKWLLQGDQIANHKK
jgi:sulfur relay (sulfurtransferase) DsrF/TusC family protein